MSLKRQLGIRHEHVTDVDITTGALEYLGMENGKLLEEKVSEGGPHLVVGRQGSTLKCTRPSASFFAIRCGKPPQSPAKALVTSRTSTAPRLPTQDRRVSRAEDLLDKLRAVCRELGEDAAGAAAEVHPALSSLR